MQEINVQEIMSEIKKNIEEKGYSEEEIEFAVALANQDNADSLTGGGEETYDNHIMQENRTYMNTYYHNPIYFPLQGNPIKVLWQKIIRKLVRFVTHNAFQYQNNFNLALVRCINQISFYIRQQEQSKNKIKNLEVKMSQQQDMIDELKKQIQDMRKEMQ